jgi:ParB family chromosome partitioning protein
MNIQTIPLNKLTPCPANVRKTGMQTGIEELAASISAHGLLQNLQVRAGSGGKFEVVAGGRRLDALKLLAKRKALPKDAGIACNLLDTEDATEISLAENVMRLPMHPADQFDAFKALADSGKGPEEIAGRFGTTPATVRQRLKLAAVSPRLIDLYRAEEMDLDQLMAFAVSDDHTAQEAAWFDQPDFNRRPTSIRRTLTAAHVEADHLRVVFVGLETYLAAGGPVSRDLFQPEHEGYLTDPALLDRLVAAKLESEAQTVRAEGWAWVEIMPEIDWNTLRRFYRLRPQRQPLPEGQALELERLAAAYDALIEAHGDDPEPEIAEQLDELSERIDALSEGEELWTPEAKAQSGALVGIGQDGAVAIERGLIRPEDKAAVSRAAGETAESSGEAPCPAPSDALPDRLTEALTAHRTAALRVLLGDSPVIALAAVTHALALATFYGKSTGSCLDLRAPAVALRGSAEDIDASSAAQTSEARHAAWSRRLPPEPEGLWEWLLAQPADTLTGLLAVCAAATVNAVRRKQDRADAPHLAHADRLATALGLDMADWWRPTAASYFGRVPKARILEAVAEGCSRGAADNLAKLKKDALILRAEEKLAGTGWLPPVLRPAVPQETAAEEPAEAV